MALSQNTFYFCHFLVLGTEGHKLMHVTFALKIISQFLPCLSGLSIDRDWKPYAVCMVVTDTFTTLE